jgi:hypothetical protein
MLEIKSIFPASKLTGLNNATLSMHMLTQDITYITVRYHAVLLQTDATALVPEILFTWTKLCTKLMHILLHNSIIY